MASHRKKAKKAIWTQEQHISLLKFLARESGTAKAPLSTTNLANKYFNGPRLKHHCIEEVVRRIIEIRKGIPGILDNNQHVSEADKRNMMFALGQPSRTTQQHRENKIKRKMLEALEKKSRRNCYPIIKEDFIADFLENCTIIRARSIYNSVKRMIYKHTDYDKFTKVRMMYVANTRITTRIFADLQVDADIRLTDQGYIEYYLPHDRSFELDRNRRRGQAKTIMAVTKEKEKVPKEEKTKKQVVDSDSDEEDDMMTRKASSSSTRRHRGSPFDSDTATPRSSSASSARTVKDTPPIRNGFSKQQDRAQHLVSDSDEDDIELRTSNRRHIDSFSDSTTPRSSTTSSARTTRGRAAKRKATTRDLESDSDEESVVSRSLQGRAHSPSFDSDLPAPQSSSTSRARTTRDRLAARNGASKRKASTRDLVSDSDEESVVSRTSKRKPRSPSPDYAARRNPSPDYQAPAPSIPALLLHQAQGPVTLDQESIRALIAALQRTQQAAPPPSGAPLESQAPAPSQASLGSQFPRAQQYDPAQLVESSVQRQVRNQASPQQPSQSATLVLQQVHDQHQPTTASTSSGAQVPPSHPFCQELHQARPVDQILVELRPQLLVPQTQHLAQRQAHLGSAQLVQPKAQRQVRNQATTSEQVIDEVLLGAQTDQKTEQLVKKPRSAHRREQQQSQAQQLLPDQPQVESNVRVKEEVEEEERAPQRYPQLLTNSIVLTNFRNFVMALELDCLDEALYKIDRAITIISCKLQRSAALIEPLLQALSLGIFIVLKDSPRICQRVKPEDDNVSMSVKGFLWSLKTMLIAFNDSLFDGVKKRVVEALKELGEQDKKCPINRICTVVEMIREAATPSGF